MVYNTFVDFQMFVKKFEVIWILKA